MDAVLFIAGDVESLRFARRASVLTATARDLDILRRGGVALDALIGSGEDEAERYHVGDLDPEPDLVVTTSGALGGWMQPGGPYTAAVVPGPREDAYGCGDSFMAGLTFALGAELEPHDAVAFARALRRGRAHGPRRGAAAASRSDRCPTSRGRRLPGAVVTCQYHRVSDPGFPSVDVDTLRTATGAWTTGVVVVTATHPDGRDAGLVMVSLAPVSQEPPLVLWSVDRNSGSLDVWLEAPGFVLHLLADDQEPLAWQFARKGNREVRRARVSLAG